MQKRESNQKKKNKKNTRGQNEKVGRKKVSEESFVHREAVVESCPVSSGLLSSLSSHSGGKNDVYNTMVSGWSYSFSFPVSDGSSQSSGRGVEGEVAGIALGGGEA